MSGGPCPAKGCFASRFLDLIWILAAAAIRSVGRASPVCPFGLYVCRADSLLCIHWRLVRLTSSTVGVTELEASPGWRLLAVVAGQWFSSLQ